MPCTAWSKPPDSVWLQGCWTSDDSLIRELRIESTPKGLLVFATGLREGRPLDWGSALVRNVSRVAETHQGDDLTPLQVSLFTARGQIDLQLSRQEDLLSATAYLTMVTGQGLQESQYHLSFTRRVAGSWEQAETSISPLSASRGGNVQGKAIGPARQAASLFQASLYGPDDPNRFYSTQSLQGDFRFQHVPEGTYWLFVEPRGTTGLVVSPRRKLIRVHAGKPTEALIELK